MTPEAKHIQFTNGHACSYRKNKVDSNFLSLYWFLVLHVWIHIIFYSSSNEGCLSKCKLQNKSETILCDAVWAKSEVNHTRENKPFPTDFI